MKQIIALCFGITASLTQLTASPKEKPTPIEVGTNAPLVSSKSDSDETINLKDLYEAGSVLVYFYPKADTPGCTKQACNLRDHYATLNGSNVTVIGVSMDSVEDQKAFKEKYKLPFTLLADTSGEVVEAFGVPRKGKFARRQAFLIKDGKVVWRDLKAKPKTQAEDALAALNKIEETKD